MKKGSKTQGDFFPQIFVNYITEIFIKYFSESKTKNLIDDLL